MITTAANQLNAPSGPLRLGRLELGVPFFMAPLSGYSDRAMRALARRFGSPLCLPGVMLDTTTINPKVIRKGINAIPEGDHPIGGQIMGHDPATMAAAAAELEKLGYDLIDLNFACPVPKVLRRGRGGCLMSRPGNLLAIYEAVREKVSCPVTMKLRTGFDSDETSRAFFWEVCERAIAGGVDALAVHGRTVLQRYKSFPDWTVPAELKRRYPEATIIGSGNLFNARTAWKRLTESGVDGVLIARGAIGNPWIFSELHALAAGRETPEPPSVAEQAEVITTHYEMMRSDYQEGKAVGLFRKFTIQYARRHPQKNDVGRALMAATSDAELFATMDQWYR